MSKTAKIFDTLQYVKKLKAAGISEDAAETHAEALAEVLNDQIATKQDVIEVKQELCIFKNEIQHEFKRLEDKIDIKTDAVNAKLNWLVSLSTVAAFMLSFMVFVKPYLHV